MTASPEVPLSKGMMMIVAYREARLRQRPVLRTNLHEFHDAACCQGQVAGEPARMTAAEIPAPVATAVAEALEPTSGSADLASLPVFDKRTGNTNTAPLMTQEPPTGGVAVATPEDASPATIASAEPVPHDPPLSEIGFGPGMLIRLSQLGLRTIGDLAHADANALRAALGDISRLVDVEAWIASARIRADMVAKDSVTAPDVHA